MALMNAGHLEELHSLHIEVESFYQSSLEAWAAQFLMIHNSFISPRRLGREVGEGRV